MKNATIFYGIAAVVVLAAIGYMVMQSRSTPAATGGGGGGLLSGLGLGGTSSKPAGVDKTPPPATTGGTPNLRQPSSSSTKNGVSAARDTVKTAALSAA